MSDKRCSRVVILKGGLGNQLFQVAVALWMREEYQAEVFLRRPERRLRSPTHARRAEVDARTFDLTWETRSPLKTLLDRTVRDGRRIVLEDGWALPGAERAVKHLEIEGYFQNIELLSVIRDKMLPTLTRDVAEREDEPFVGVHLRMNDYLIHSTRSVHGVTDPAWALKRASELAHDLSINRIVIFTDSPAIVLKFLQRTSRREYVMDDSENPWALLMRMSRAQGFVMGNSSLSWWSALLCGMKEDSRVMFPTPWLSRSGRMDSALLVPGWCPVQREILAE
jgi:hypothetical protein